MKKSDEKIFISFNNQPGLGPKRNHLQMIFYMIWIVPEFLPCPLRSVRSVPKKKNDLPLPTPQMEGKLGWQRGRTPTISLPKMGLPFLAIRGWRGLEQTWSMVNQWPQRVLKVVTHIQCMPRTIPIMVGWFPVYRSPWYHHFIFPRNILLPEI